MSSVFLSYDLTLGTTIAVKVLADHLAHSREFVSRFYREARLSRLLAHPNLVRGLGAGYDPGAGKHYLILEFIDGPTAQTILSRIGRFPVSVAVQIGIDMANALAFLHTRQYVHRDVKPDNILLHPDGIAKLADLGLAKRLNDDPNITSTHVGVGTSYYMAYEQALNANFVDGRSDIFALGATLYHLLTGEVPFPGATHEEIVQGKEQSSYRPIRELNPDVPASLAEIITTTLARDPRARFQTAAELVSALEATHLAEPIPAYPHIEALRTDTAVPEAPTRADLPTPDSIDSDHDAPLASPPEASPAPPSPPSVRRPNLWLPFRAGLGLLLAAGLCGMVAAAAGMIAVPAHRSLPAKSLPKRAPVEDTNHSPDGPGMAIQQ